MPGKVKVKVLAGRNLPVMDKGSDTTDAYVEIKLGNVTHKTDICRKSLNPQWNSTEWYRFEMDDAELQDEPLQLRLMDHDTYSANDAIGKVYISLNPLLLPEAQQHPHHATPAATHSGKGSVMSGWIPVFDTMHGIRGEVNVIVKVELFNDFNKFRQSSCGVQFFHSPIIPHGYQAQVIHGFVEELVINDDPEYQWIDKIRTPRASNEARQVAFLKLSGQVQRKIGLKALELGANAVIGFRRCLDLEGDVGVVARGAGTAVTLIHQQEPPSQSNNGTSNIAASPDTLAQSGGAAVINPAPDCGSPRHARADSHGGKPPPTSNLNINPSHRRSSDSDLSITPKGNSLTAGVCGGAVLRPTMNQESIDMLEYPFLTIIKFPPGFILHIGGAVAARSVKLLERVPNPEEPAPRDAWWSELRTEVRSHMRALRCNAVLAYQETTTICDDVCVLSATGTAAVIDLHPSATMPHATAHPSLSSATTASGKVKSDPSNNNSAKTAEGDAGRAELTQTSSLDRTDFEKNEQSNPKQNADNNNRRRGGGGERCGPCHVPYSSGSVPYRVSVSKCALCKKGRVPSVVLCSVEPIEGLAIIGRGCLLQAVASRARTPARGEPAARDISDQLPFLEYELHRLLLAKLRVRGMNAIFGLKTTIAVGSGVVAAVGVGTGVLLAALGPGTGGPRLRAAPGDPHHLQGLQQKLDEAFQDNRKVYQLNTDQESNGKAVVASDTEESDEELPDVDLGSGNKDTCVLEVDDAEDLEVLRVLTEARPPAGLHVVNTQSVPGLLGCGLVSVRNLQMFTQLWRARLSSPPGALHPHFHRLLLSVYFKLRRMVPCAVCDLRFRLDLPEADEIQLVVTGMAVGLTEAVSVSGDGKLPKVVGSPLQVSVDTVKKTDIKDAISSGPVKKSESNEMIFTLEEETVVDVNGPSKFNIGSPAIPANSQNTSTSTSATPSWRPGVDMTPLAGVPGAKVERYLGNLDFVFVRESTSIRELGGLSGFLHSFITEVLAVVRAHVTALGGNAIVAFYMTELILSDSPHKNQAQCLVSVGGDVVFVSYFPVE